MLLDYLCFPLLYFVQLAGLLMFFLNGGSLSTVLAWAAAACMLRTMAGNLYAISQGDDVRLSVLAPLFDFYQETLLNCGGAMSMFDQARGGNAPERRRRRSPAYCCTTPANIGLAGDYRDAGCVLRFTWSGRTLPRREGAVVSRKISSGSTATSAGIGPREAK